MSSNYFTKLSTTDLEIFIQKTVQKMLGKKILGIYRKI